MSPLFVMGKFLVNFFYALSVWTILANKSHFSKQIIVASCRFFLRLPFSKVWSKSMGDIYYIDRMNPRASWKFDPLEHFAQRDLLIIESNRKIKSDTRLVFFNLPFGKVYYNIYHIIYKSMKQTTIVWSKLT